MKKINASIHINAPREKVWNTMLEKATYIQWAKAFAEGSHYEGDWSEGSEILFLGSDKSGMISRIEQNVPYSYISIKHIGIISNGNRDTSSEKAKIWSPAFENYTFKTNHNGTQLHVDVEIHKDYEELFSKMWQDALQLLKVIAEKK